MQLIKDNSNFFVKSLSCIKAVIISALVIFISCSEIDELLVTEQTSKTSNGRFELSLTIDPDIVYDNSSTKLIAKIKRLIPRDSMLTVLSDTTISTEPSMYCLINSVGGELDIHSLIYDDKVNEKKYFQVTIDDAIGSTWEGLAFYNPATPLKERGHISAIFDGMNLTLPVKLVTNPNSAN